MIESDRRLSERMIVSLAFFSKALPRFAVSPLAFNPSLFLAAAAGPPIHNPCGGAAWKRQTATTWPEN
jgi:hypothetical protein